MNGHDDTLSVTAAAEHLGVSRWSVWRMIAAGELDAESTVSGKRLVTRVQLPQLCDDDPSPRSRTSRLQERVDRLTHSVECLSEMLLKAERERAELRNELERHAMRPAPELPMLSPAPPPALAPSVRVEAELVVAPRREPTPPPAAAATAPPPRQVVVEQFVPPPRQVVAEQFVPPLQHVVIEHLAPPADTVPHGITARPNPMTHPASLFLPTRGPAGEELLQPVRNLFKRDDRRRSWWHKLPVARG